MLRKILCLGTSLCTLCMAASAPAQSLQLLDPLKAAGLSPDGNTVLGQTLGQAAYWTKSGGITTIPVMGTSSVAKFTSISGDQIVGEVSTASGTGVFWWNGTSVDIVAPNGTEGDFTLKGCDSTGNTVVVSSTHGYPSVLTRTSRRSLPGLVGIAPDGTLFGWAEETRDTSYTNAVYWPVNGRQTVILGGGSYAGMGRVTFSDYKTIAFTANHKWFASGYEYYDHEKHPEEFVSRSVIYSPVSDWTLASYNVEVGNPIYSTADGNGVFFSAIGDSYLQDVHSPLNYFYNVTGGQGLDVAPRSVVGMSQDGLTFAGTSVDNSGEHSFYLHLASTLGNSSFHLTPYQENAVPSPGVLKSPIGWPVNPTLASQPSHGTAVVNTDGSFTYTPIGNFIGRDTFQVRNSAGTEPPKNGTVVLHVGVPTVLYTNVSAAYGGSGTAVRGSVSVNFKAKTPVTLTLKSTHPEAASVPATVTIPVGYSSQTFPITTHATDGDVATTIVATLDTVSVTKTFAVLRNVVSTLSVPQIFGTNTSGVTAHLYLTGPAGPAGVHVVLRVLNGVLAVPSSVNVAPGATSVAVPIKVQTNVARVVGITANGKLFPVNVIGLVRASPGNMFSPKALTASRLPAFSTALRTTVAWYNADSVPHSVTNDTPGGPNSDIDYPGGIPPGKYFFYTVDPSIPSGGIIYYHCRFKGAAGDGNHVGTGMAGSVTVK